MQLKQYILPPEKFKMSPEDLAMEAKLLLFFEEKDKLVQLLKNCEKEVLPKIIGSILDICIELQDYTTYVDYLKMGMGYGVGLSGIDKFFTECKDENFLIEVYTLLDFFPFFEFSDDRLVSACRGFINVGNKEKALEVLSKIGNSDAQSKAIYYLVPELSDEELGLYDKSKTGELDDRPISFMIFKNWWNGGLAVRAIKERNIDEFFDKFSETADNAIKQRVLSSVFQICDYKTLTEILNYSDIINKLIKNSPIQYDLGMAYIRFGIPSKALDICDKHDFTYEYKVNIIREVLKTENPSKYFDQIKTLGDQMVHIKSAMEIKILLYLTKNLPINDEVVIKMLKLYVEPKIIYFGSLSDAQEIISRVFKILKLDFNYTVSNSFSNKVDLVENDNTSLQSSNDQINEVDPRIQIKKQTDNLHLFSNSFKEVLKNVLSLKAEIDNLDAFRGKLIQKIVNEEDVRLSSRVLVSIMYKMPKESLRYLEKFLFSLPKRLSKLEKQDKYIQKQFSDYLEFFIKLAIKNKVLEPIWEEYITNPEYFESINNIIFNREKKVNWGMIDLTSLLLNLSKLNFKDHINDFDWIYYCLENNIVSPTFYKILYQIPLELRSQVLDLAQAETSKAFGNEIPSLDGVFTFLDENNISLIDLMISDEDLLAEIITVSFGIADYESVKNVLIYQILPHQDDIDTHLSEYFAKGLPSDSIKFTTQIVGLKNGESINQGLVSKIKYELNNFNSISREIRESEKNAKQIANAKNLDDISDISLYIIFEFINAGDQVLNRFYNVTQFLDLDFNNTDLAIDTHSIYFTILFELKEMFGIVLRDNIDDILESWFPDEVFDQNKKEFLVRLIQRHYQKIIGNDINAELRKFTSVNIGEKSEVNVSVSKNPVSFFAKMGVGICTANDYETWREPKNHFHINLLRDDQLVANIQGYIEEVNGENVLVLRGLNPTQEFLQDVSAKEFVDEILSFCFDLAKHWELDGVYLTDHLEFWHADSNRELVRKLLRGEIYPNSQELIYEMPITFDKTVDKIYKISDTLVNIAEKI